MSLLIISICIYLITLIRIRKKDVFQPEIILNLYFITLIGIGPITLYFFSKELFDSDSYQRVIYIVNLGYISLNLGFYLRARQTGCSTANVIIKKYTKLRYNYKFCIKIFLIAGVIASLLFFLRAGMFPLLEENKDVARVEALSVSGNGYLLYIMTWGMYGCALGSVIFYSTKMNVIYFLLAIGVVGVLMTLTGSRRYILWILLYVLIARHYLHKRIKLWQIFVFSALGLLFVNLFEMYRNPFSDTTTDIYTAFTYRFVLYISNLEKVLTAFSYIDYQYGSTFFMDVLTALPGKQVDYQSWLKNVTQLEFEGFGIPPTVMGDLYVNFGYVGILLGCVIIGYVARWVYDKYIVVERSIIGVFYYMLILEVFSKTITSGVSAQLISFLWLGIFFMVFNVIKKLDAA